MAIPLISNVGFTEVSSSGSLNSKAGDKTKLPVQFFKLSDNISGNLRLDNNSAHKKIILDTNGNNISLLFVPDSEFTDEVTVQSYNQILYTESDFNNLAGSLKYGAVETDVLLSTYDGLAGRRANKTKFDLTFEGTPIYTKTFDPDGAGLAKSTGIFTIPNHFYNTDEELLYEPTSTFIGIAATAVSIGATINNAGITTDILPSTVLQK